MPEYDGWELIGKPIGEGGQGTVYRARRPERVKQLEDIAKEAEQLLHQLSTVAPAVSMPDLARKIVELGRDDRLKDIGALKRFKIPSDDKEEEGRAVGRLESEVQALKNINHPAVLKLLHSNITGRFIVTEYHPSGTLDKQLQRFKGNVLRSLEAFRPLVDAVVDIHEGYHPRSAHDERQTPRAPAIHRDIKPENVFVTELGDLVLGDFGIVFFKERGRLTSTYERVGSHYWMAPWAYRNEKLEIEEINPSLDMFPLAKVLWSMISGRSGFPFWEWEREENNLEILFPGDPHMHLVNGLLATCIVREEKHCTRSAGNLLIQVDTLIAQLRERSGFRPDGANTWPCRVCGKGKYQNGGQKYQVKGYHDITPVQTQEIVLNIYVCDSCGHAELFTQ